MSSTAVIPRASENQVTIYKVAEKAGVSTATVSRVLSGFITIRPETRDRVLSIAQEMGFSPNPVAQQLALRRKS